MNRALRVALTVLVLVVSATSRSHTGGVDENYCHREAATGTRHCHPERAYRDVARQYSRAHPPRKDGEGVFFGPLVQVIDGDTLLVRVQGVVMDFRLAEIDAPEMDQPYGRQSQAELQRLLSGKKTEVLLVPIDTDSYGRTVARVWVGRKYINEAMVEAGAAHFYDEYSSDATLFEVEERARAAKRGLWALPLKNRVVPWEWRHEKR